MFPAKALVGVRRAGIASFFAVWLILLTISPFTAPFSTCDDAELTAEMSVLDKRVGAKFTDDVVEADAGAILCRPTDVVVSLVDVIVATGPRDRPALFTVLRI